MLSRLALCLVVLGAGACDAARVIPDTVPKGTWGGDDGGLIVTAEGAHAHVGCTLGDVTGPIALDAKAPPSLRNPQRGVVDTRFLVMHKLNTLTIS